MLIHASQTSWEVSWLAKGIGCKPVHATNLFDLGWLGWRSLLTSVELLSITWATFCNFQLILGAMRICRVESAWISWSRSVIKDVPLIINVGVSVEGFWSWRGSVEGFSFWRVRSREPISGPCRIRPQERGHARPGPVAVNGLMSEAKPRPLYLLIHRGWID